MRLWSIHPRYLDSKGLVALWRESLLAKKVLLGQTKGYKHHPQLERFKETSDPIASIDFYLKNIYLEAKIRNYSFDSTKVCHSKPSSFIRVSTGQIEYESIHLQKKLHQRSPEMKNIIDPSSNIIVHPLFVKVGGPIATWEKVLAGEDSNLRSLD